MLPNLIIIGGMKCGTSSLHHYLSLHPQICMSKIKELNYFPEDLNWKKGVRWYQSHFNCRAQIYGEASTAYTAFPHYPGVPEKIYRLIPKTKLIYLIRNPVERIISHYMDYVSEGVETRPINDVLKNFHNNEYVDRSRYAFQLDQYLEFFPKGKILVVKQEDLLRQRLETLQKIFRFLTVDESFRSQQFGVKLNESRYKRRKNRFGRLLSNLNKTGWFNCLSRPLTYQVGRWVYIPFSKRIETSILDQGLERELMDYFQEGIKRLETMTGYDLSEWNRPQR